MTKINYYCKFSVVEWFKKMQNCDFFFYFKILMDNLKFCEDFAKHFVAFLVSELLILVSKYRNSKLYLEVQICCSYKL